MKAILVAVTMMLLLAGCSSMGGEDKFSRSYVSSHIIPNKTTEAEVQALYGTPDNQFSSSSGGYSWSFNKGGNLSTASSVMGYVPGASAISGALGMATSASNASDTMTRASGKMTGDTSHHGSNLEINFNKNKVVTSWYL
ncbi:hypothetical protein ACQV2E_00770 [Pantoea allii]|uniref:hypothetical protein n=1 Tax=Pantoea TaxID=53335 RepID=UPI000A236EBF|nr:MULTISPECIES: hypothetical protein [Pantoea]MBW1251240.1 hypothetical protein [Pantoea allii]MBW1261025.1 hypothetical protein [Pantoea allii]MBW1282434.1 hypothetical protein [Pantoea allii]MDJ0039706.1 hypothetical protein [Pantoea allii]MDJ0088614.1 hypothetical protein [Pantoea allii]